MSCSQVTITEAEDDAAQVDERYCLLHPCVERAPPGEGIHKEGLCLVPDLLNLRNEAEQMDGVRDDLLIVDHFGDGEGGAGQRRRLLRLTLRPEK